MTNSNLVEKTIREKIYSLYEEFLQAKCVEPMYANCLVKFNNDDTTIDACIKLDCDVDENEDYYIFFYCNGIVDLTGMTEKGPGTDFVIVDIFSFE